MIDGHMHLENGPLSVEYVMKFVDAGVKMHMDTIHILDHTHRFQEFLPLYTKLKEASPYQRAWLEKKTVETLSAYFDVIEKVKSMQLPIEVKFGLEVCYTPEDKPFLHHILGQYPYDFLIGSIHSIDGLLYDMQGFSKEILWDKYDTNVIYKRYYEILADMICSGLFTQIAHPDQLKIFNYEPTYDLTATYERIAQLAKTYDVYMESNTGCFYRYHHADLGTNAEFMSVLKAYHVKIMTASDAHCPQHVGMYIKELCEKLSEIS